MDNNNLIGSDLSETFKYVMEIDKSILSSQPLVSSDSGIPNSDNRLSSVSLLQTIVLISYLWVYNFSIQVIINFF
jgi:hypothetical protein